MNKRYIYSYYFGADNIIQDDGYLTIKKHIDKYFDEIIDLEDYIHECLYCLYKDRLNIKFLSQKLELNFRKYHKKNKEIEELLNIGNDEVFIINENDLLTDFILKCESELEIIEIFEKAKLSQQQYNVAWDSFILEKDILELQLKYGISYNGLNTCKFHAKEKIEKVLRDDYNVCIRKVM